MNAVRKTPRYVVQLTDAGDQQLAVVFGQYMKKNSIGRYFIADTVDPAGPYFFMSVDTGVDGEDGQNIELSIPHAYVRFFMRAQSDSAIGFLRDK